jgi:hypothetical protein
MDATALREAIRRTPFVPFEIKMSDGLIYPADHPELVSLSPDRRIAMCWMEDNRPLFLDVHRITAVESRNRQRPRDLYCA